MKADIIKYETINIISEQLGIDNSLILDTAIFIDLCRNEAESKRVIVNIEKTFDINIIHNIELLKKNDLNGLCKEIETAISNKPLHKHFF